VISLPCPDNFANPGWFTRKGTDIKIYRIPITEVRSSDGDSSWEEDDGMLHSLRIHTSQPNHIVLEQQEAPSSDEVYKYVDYASAIRVNEKFKLIEFSWKKKPIRKSLCR